MPHPSTGPLPGPEPSASGAGTLTSTSTSSSPSTRPLIPRPSQGTGSGSIGIGIGFGTAALLRSYSHHSSFEADDERSTTTDRDEAVDYHLYDPSSSAGQRRSNGSSRSSSTASQGGRRSSMPASSALGDRGGGGPGSLTSSTQSLRLSGAKFQGEDTRPTSSKELAGWYMYAFAAETYVICGSFIPILLESLARENGVLLSDHTTPCGTSYDTSKKDEGQCVIYVLGVEINTASFAMYTFSISVLLQALLVVSISCAADHGNYRKRLLLTFAWIGSTSLMLFIFVSKSLYIFGAVLTIVSNTSFGASFVLLNSFLPVLVRNHPDVRKAAAAAAVGTPDLGADAHHAPLDSQPLESPPALGESEDDGDDLDNSTTNLLAAEAGVAGSTSSSAPAGHRLVRRPTEHEMTSLELQLSTTISSRGIGIGYGAGLFLQIGAILILVAMGSSTWSQRVVLFVVGLWWTVFTIPSSMWLRPRPGPPLPMLGRASASPGNPRPSGPRSWLPYIAYSWKSLFRTVHLARKLLDIVLFLGGWFLLSDAIATTSSTAIMFAKTQLHMKPWALGLINVISTLAGVLGAFSWSLISKKLKLQPHQTILVCIALFEIIPLYGLMGYLPFVKAWGVLGLQQPWEMYPLAAIYGFALGGLSGYCRSLFGELIPPGSEAAFYALYAITDKGSSVFGPAIVGAIIDASGEIRPAFWFLACLVGFPAPLIWFVNVDRGKREGEKLAEVIEGFKLGNGNAAVQENGAAPGAYDEAVDGDADMAARGNGVR